MRTPNFSAGPAGLPEEVLLQAQSELLDYKQSGASIMEVSHRGQAFSTILESAQQRLRTLLGLSDDDYVLFLQGGASHQFMMVPYNFLSSEHSAIYLDTGAWSGKAIKEAKRFGSVTIPFSNAEEGYKRVPAISEYAIDPHSAYVHFTSNNTIFGTQYSKEPETNGVPLVCDASSDFLSRTINIQKYGLIYAGAQKNLGPSGCAVVVIRRSFYERKNKSGSIPTILDYATHAGKLFHTPPTFTIYLIDLVLAWLERKGGVNGIESINNEKAKRVYTCLDSDDFYRTHASRESRSKMNVLFRTPSKQLDELFVQKSSEEGLLGLKAHRTTGGLRASLYNAVSLNDVEVLISFLNEFRKTFG